MARRAHLDLIIQIVITRSLIFRVFFFFKPIWLKNRGTISAFQTWLGLPVTQTAATTTSYVKIVASVNGCCIRAFIFTTENHHFYLSWLVHLKRKDYSFTHRSRRRHSRRVNHQTVEGQTIYFFPRCYSFRISTQLYENMEMTWKYKGKQVCVVYLCIQQQ